MGNQSKPEHPEGAVGHTLEIPAGTMVIGDGAFTGRTDIVRVLIPGSVTSIGAGAFCGCSSLTGVVISGPVTFIGDCAFKGCSSLTSVVIPGSVTFIGYEAFCGCGSLPGVVIPDSVTSIDDCAFQHCRSLTSVVILGSVTSIGSYAFDGCSSLASVLISGPATSIKHAGAFSRCSPDLTIDFGNTGQPFRTFDPNRHPTFRGYTRTATCERPIPSVGPGARCITRHTWPPSRLSSAPLGPPILVDCVDGDGASLPLPLGDLSGDLFPVYNCWGPRTATAPDGTQTPQPSFKQLAAEQYPDALANPDEWEVVLRAEDPSPTPTLDLVQVATMLARDEFDPWANAVFLLWTDPNPDITTGSTVGPASSGAALALQSTGSRESAEIATAGVDVDVVVDADEDSRCSEASAVTTSGAPTSATGRDGEEPKVKRARTDADAES